MLEEGIDRLWENVAGRGSWRDFPVPFPPRWSPTLDVMQKPEGMLIRAELPGLTDRDIRLSVSENRLTLRADKPGTLAPEPDEDMTASGRHFVKEMELPPDTDPRNVRAIFRDGILQIRIPRREAMPRPLPKAILRGCSACKGDLFHEEDDEYTCLQCGRRTRVSNVPAQADVPGEARKSA